MSVLDRAALEDSPLADLHAIASELGIDGYRRLRKADLIDAILARQGGEPAAATTTAPRMTAPSRPAQPPRRPRRRATSERDGGAGRPRPTPKTSRRRGGRAKRRPPPARRPWARRRPAASRRAERRARARAQRRPRRGGAERSRGRSSRASSSCSPTAPASCASAPPEPSDDDVYISAAQVKRCELGPATASAGRGARRAAPSASPRWSGSTRSTAGRPTRWPTAALRRPAGRVPDRALRARLRGPDRSRRSSS